MEWLRDQMVMAFIVIGVLNVICGDIMDDILIGVVCLQEGYSQGDGKQVVARQRPYVYM